MTALQRWPGRYTDRHGTEDVVFESDGRESIRTTIRGVLFEGDVMDDLGALGGNPPERMFSFRDGALYFCLLEWDTPLLVDVRGSGVRPGTLRCVLRLGDPAGPRPGPDLQTLSTTLRLDGYEFGSGTLRFDFEQALRDVQRALPRAARLRSCVSCAWSDYSPLGNGMMAGLACFRDVKDRYRRVDAKHGPTGIFAVWDDLTEFVQETWLCPEFEHRGTHKGYRGSFP